MSPAKRPSETGISRALRAAPAAAVEPAETTPPDISPAGSPPRPAAVATPRRPRAARPVRTAPVRITLDLVPELHEFLRDFAQGAGVVGADIMRELLRQLRDDPDLAARVESEIHRRREAVREARRLAES